MKRIISDSGDDDDGDSRQQPPVRLLKRSRRLSIDERINLDNSKSMFSSLDDTKNDKKSKGIIKDTTKRDNLLTDDPAITPPNSPALGVQPVNADDSTEMEIEIINNTCTEIEQDDDEKSDIDINPPSQENTGHIVENDITYVVDHNMTTSSISGDGDDDSQSINSRASSLTRYANGTNNNHEEVAEDCYEEYYNSHNSEESYEEDESYIYRGGGYSSFDSDESACSICGRYHY